MKKLLVSMLLLFVVMAGFAQDKKEAVVKIKTSAVCDMCKATIEKDMIFEKGVKKSELEVETAILTVTYNPKKTSPEAIRERISKIGYDADSVKRDMTAFKNLPDCCQKPGIHRDN